MTTQEALDKVASEEGFTNWGHLLIYEEGCTSNITRYAQKAMKLYAKQFIDVANEIIYPASDVLGKTYDKDYEEWYVVQTINK